MVRYIRSSWQRSAQLELLHGVAAVPLPLDRTTSAPPGALHSADSGADYLAPPLFCVYINSKHSFMSFVRLGSG